ncbi:MAG: hypothetical protein ICV87_06315 [Gemmatimonadetes bacterium]|nr:hypothetical protein [Gemmatimonadota bacterium]
MRQVALVSEVGQISASELSRVAAALQKQAARDFAPIWEVQATVDAFARLEDVPLGYWPMIVMKDIGVDGAAGIHLDKDGQPFALIEYSNRWALTASHENLEMLADPFGNRVVAGPSLHPNQGRVEYLVEVCDPSEDMEFGYTVNGVLVSDFYTPAYFDPVASAGVRYSFTGAITQPREVLKGGYISWHEPVSDHWWQKTFFGDQPTFRDLGRLTSFAGSIRATIDALTEHPVLVTDAPLDDPRFAAAAEAMVQIEASTDSKAAAWRMQINALLGAQ